MDKWGYCEENVNSRNYFVVADDLNCRALLVHNLAIENPGILIYLQVQKVVTLDQRQHLRPVADMFVHVNRPETWSQFYVNASGQRQSPVDIVTTKIVGSVQNPLTIKYSTDNCLDIVNSGYGWKVHCSGNNTELTGGPLEGRYILEQFHCHWGQTDDKGSEHTVDGESYSGELHLVHWNATKYQSFAEAAEHRDGLAVVAVFLQVGDSHEEIKKLTNLLPKILYNGEKFDLSDIKIDIEKCLPDDLSYWTYPGSLTTPPCSETVDWLVLKAPIHISRCQLNLFRTLRYHKRGEEPPKDEMNGKLMKNYRPVFPIGDRMVRDFGCR